MGRKVIVTTTIHPVTEAIEKFQKIPDWELIVVGDQKTPADYRLERGLYLTPEMQEKYDLELSDAIGWNCIQRRNFGLLWAYESGADVVALVDDDNIPYDHWGKDLLINKNTRVICYDTDLPAFDPVGATNEKHLWHRGFPIQLVSSRNYSNRGNEVMKFDVEADFWNGDPDVDAVCRMVYNPRCTFKDEFFPMASKTFSPFNSQNTFLSRECLKDYFLFPSVGRMDDIWASYYVQSLGRKVVYNRASVFQDRNEHNLIQDMKLEYRGYEDNLRLIEKLKENPENIKDFLPERSWRAFEIFRSHFEKS